MNTETVCTHTRVTHQHGTRAAYAHDKCRCEPCRTANREYERNRTRARAYGHVAYVDAQPARDHIRSLMQQGMGWRTIVATQAISHGCLVKLIYGAQRSDGRRVHSQRIRQETSDRVLALTPDLALRALVPALGATRRLQGLCALGWSQRQLAHRTGLDSLTIHALATGARDQVTNATHTLIANLYDELAMTPPPASSPRRLGIILRAKRLAASHGWAPPLAWDDDDIDNPSAKPSGIAGQEPAQRTYIDDVEELLALGETPALIAERLGKNPAVIARTARRNNRPELACLFERAA